MLYVICIIANGIVTSEDLDSLSVDHIEGLGLNIGERLRVKKLLLLGNGKLVKCLFALLYVEL